jgi:hypothetical protein
MGISSQIHNVWATEKATLKAIMTFDIVGFRSETQQIERSNWIDTLLDPFDSLKGSL